MKFILISNRQTNSDKQRHGYCQGHLRSFDLNYYEFYLFNTIDINHQKMRQIFHLNYECNTQKTVD